LTNELSYDPGDIAVIHPEACPADVESLLTTMGWSNAADEPIRIERVFEGLFSTHR
jgi:sulfite reductase alpha subunit-like flavoprotein